MTSASIQAKFRTEGTPAPDQLVIVHGFLNTLSDELGIEDFATPESTQLWLQNAGLWEGEKKLSKDQYEKILSFRRDLRAWILHKEITQSLNELAVQIPLTAQFDANGEVSLQPTGDACDKALGALIGVISQSIQNGTWSRLKCCDLPTCGWAFYDSTRSRTKRWCSMKTCGSRHKAREYYKRNK